MLDKTNVFSELWQNIKHPIYTIMINKNRKDSQRYTISCGLSVQSYIPLDALLTSLKLYSIPHTPLYFRQSPSLTLISQIFLLDSCQSNQVNLETTTTMSATGMTLSGKRPERKLRRKLLAIDWTARVAV